MIILLSQIDESSVFKLAFIIVPMMVGLFVFFYYGLVAFSNGRKSTKRLRDMMDGKAEHSRLPISEICPQCGSTKYTRVEPEMSLALRSDRKCKECKTHYSPPIPRWMYLNYCWGGLAIIAGIIIGLWFLPENLQLSKPYDIFLPLLIMTGFFAGGMLVITGIKLYVKLGKSD